MKLPPARCFDEQLYREGFCQILSMLFMLHVDQGRTSDIGWVSTAWIQELRRHGCSSALSELHLDCIITCAAVIMETTAVSSLQQSSRSSGSLALVDQALVARRLGYSYAPPKNGARCQWRRYESPAAFGGVSWDSDRSHTHLEHILHLFSKSSRVPS